jgi:hypothetical protein
MITDSHEFIERVYLFSSFTLVEKGLTKAD